MADRAVLKPRWLQVIPIGSSATMADQAVLKRDGLVAIKGGGSATMADQAVLKPDAVCGEGDAVQQPWQIERFSNRREGAIRRRWFSNHGRSSGSQTCGCGYAV